jgi:hypothetical protein
MILGQDVLRLLSVKALKAGQTWPGDRVYDSPTTPADLKIEEERAPFIGVYTDDADVDLEGDSLHNPDARVYLTIECAVADQVVVPPKPPESNAHGPPGVGQTITLAQTDAGLELSIGFIAQQALQALLAVDNPWAELWRQFTVAGRSRVEVRRGGPGQQQQQSAIRFASRIMRMQLTVLADPVYGEPIPKGFWQDFFDLAEKDEELGGIAALIKAHFETTPPVPSWRIEQKRGTYTLRGLTALGIAPLDIPDIEVESRPPEYEASHGG